MSFIDTFKEVFNLAPPSPTTKLITINSAVDYAELPRGFFRVETASGRETLGYKGPSFLSWEVGETVVDGGKRITLDRPRTELPIVRLDFRQEDARVHRVGGLNVIDTDSLDSWDGSVEYGNETLRRGVDFI